MAVSGAARLHCCILIYSWLSQRAKLTCCRLFLAVTNMRLLWRVFVLQQMRNLVARCLQKDPHSRPSATELLQDKFFKV